MTLGNAVIAYSDLSKDYFGDASEKVTYRSACISMAVANFISFLLGGMPLCHGAGGLAAVERAKSGGRQGEGGGFLPRGVGRAEVDEGADLHLLHRGPGRCQEAVAPVDAEAQMGVAGPGGRLARCSHRL